MVFSRERECVCAIYRPQSSISQNGLCTDDHLIHTHILYILSSSNWFDLQEM